MGFSLKKLWKATGAKAVYGAIANPVGAVGDLLGGGGHSQLGAVNRDFRSAQDANALGTARALTERRRAIKETRAGFAGARGAVDTARASAVQTVQDQGRVAEGGAKQGLIDRGLYNTTVLDNAQQGISSGVSRSIADIDSHYAQILGELGIGEASAVSGIRNQNANAVQQGGQFSAGLYGQHAGILASGQFEDPNEWLNALLGIAGTATGAYVGKHI